MWLCEDKLKRKTAHFRLPSASQTRACLGSLIFSGHGELETVLLEKPEARDLKAFKDGAY